MSVLFETSFSPLLKFEEPGDTWWFDWYPSGNQKSESFLQKYRESQLEAATFVTEHLEDTPVSAAVQHVDEEKQPPADVPCMAMDLELEIAVLEEQARSDCDLDRIPFEDDVAFMGNVTKSFPTMDPIADAPCGPVVTIPTRNVTRRSYKVNKDVVAPTAAEAEDPNECSNQHCSTAITDVDHSSEEDNATYVSSAHKPDLPASALPAVTPYTTISLTRKPARHTLKIRPSAIPSAPNSNDAMTNTNNSDLVDDTTGAGDVASWPEPGALSPLKRAAGALPLLVKVPRRGTRDGTSPRSQIADGEDGDEDSGHVSNGSGTAISCGSSKSSKSFAGVTRQAEKPAPAKLKRKGKGAKAAAARKRAAGRPAAPIPGVRSCSQCGAQSTPVWRAGPFGPKTLCNACGVRYMKTAKKK